MSKHTCSQNTRRGGEPPKESNCEACKDAWAQLAHSMMCQDTPSPAFPIPRSTAERVADVYLTGTETF